MASEKLRLFISWSGELSKDVALAISEWLPYLFDGIEPWVSDKDIDSGARGLSEIETLLAECAYGLIIVTSENQKSPWINFEAGAISKSVEAETRVIPLLVDLRIAQLAGPLSQFQAREFTLDGMQRVVGTLAQPAGVASQLATERFKTYWPKLEQVTQQAIEKFKSGAHSKPIPRSAEEMLEEVLTQVREISRSTEKWSEPSQGHAEKAKNFALLISSLNTLNLDAQQTFEIGVLGIALMQELLHER